MANEDNVQWHLPEALRITNPKVAQQARDLAKDLKPKAISPFQHLSPQDFLKNRAAGRIPHLMDDLNRVEEALKYERGRDSVHKLREAYVAIRQKLAESFAILGRYDLACEMTLHPEYKAEYAKNIEK